MRDFGGYSSISFIRGNKVPHTKDEFWDTNTQGPDIKVDHPGPQPWGHHPTSSAHPLRAGVEMKLPTVVY
jgi:hypothetical protein